MDADTCLRRLVKVLSERDIGLGYEDLAWLFESEETHDDMVAWVNEYLNERTLLSREELELYSNMSDNGSFISAMADKVTARPLEQLDFEHSIEALEGSTTAIDQQCMILKAQLDALRMIHERNGQPAPGNDTESRRRQRPDRADDPDIETERLADSLRRRVADLQREANSTIAASKTGAQRQLDKDDRLLDSLQKLMSNVEPSKSQEAKIAEVTRLSQTLVSLQGTIIKNHADQLYLSALGETPGTDNLLTDEAAAAESENLASELDSLMGEVDAVLDMVIEHQYRRPIIDDLRRCDAEANEKQQKWLSYVQTALQQMSSRLHDIYMATQDLIAYGTALANVSATLGQLAISQASDSRKTVKSKQQVPRSRPSHKAVRQLVLPATTSTHPVVDLLRHHGIHVVDPSYGEGRLKATIEAAIAERTMRLAGLSLSTEQGITSHISSSVNVADTQLQGLLNAVYTHSPYATVNLADPDCNDRMQRLDDEVDALAAELRRVELEGLIESERRQLDDLLSSGDAILRLKEN